MYVAVKDVKPIENYTLILTFDDGSVKLFDMKPYLEKGVFKELKYENLFKTVRVSYPTIKVNYNYIESSNLIVDYVYTFVYSIQK